MNLPLKSKHNHISGDSPSRSGMTIIEVLTAMVVAMIGVFGIMILIPFAIKQAKSGLDLDDATRNVTNAIEMLEINGMDRMVRIPVSSVPPVTGERGLFPTWFGDMNATPPYTFTTGNSTGTVDGIDHGRVNTFGAYSMDPMSVGVNGYDRFPPTSSIIANGYLPADVPNIREIIPGLFDPASNALTPMSLFQSQRLFRTTDDLQFGVFDEENLSAADLAATGIVDFDLLPPRAYVDSDGGGGVARRQSRGEISWQSILVPVKDDLNGTPPLVDPTPPGIRSSGAWNFREYVLIYENRVLDHTSAVPLSIFPIAQVVNPASGISFAGGNVTVDKPIDDVRKNDWVMLINQDPGLEPGFQFQIGFYRVVDTFNDTMTLDGPDFKFGPDSQPTPQAMTTYAVHLVNYNGPDFLGANPKLNRQGRVISVFERTMRLKEKSVWNQ